MAHPTVAKASSCCPFSFCSTSISNSPEQPAPGPVPSPGLLCQDLKAPKVLPMQLSSLAGMLTGSVSCPAAHKALQGFTADLVLRCSVEWHHCHALVFPHTAAWPCSGQVPRIT